MKQRDFLADRIRWTQEVLTDKALAATGLPSHAPKVTAGNVDRYHKEATEYLEWCSRMQHAKATSELWPQAKEGSHE